jgi:hypothetical protein
MQYEVGKYYEYKHCQKYRCIKIELNEGLFQEPLITMQYKDLLYGGNNNIYPENGKNRKNLKFAKIYLL